MGYWERHGRHDLQTFKNSFLCTSHIVAIKTILTI